MKRICKIQAKPDKDGDHYLEMGKYIITIWTIINSEDLIQIWCLKASIKWCRTKTKLILLISIRDLTQLSKRFIYRIKMVIQKDIAIQQEKISSTSKI